MKRSLTAALIVSLLAGAGALACCMLGKDFKGKISQNAQQAIIIYHEDHEDLIVRIDYKIESDVAPTNFAWILTVPYEPDQYALADPRIFDDVAAWTQRLRMKPAGSRGALEAKAEHGLEFGKPARVGPYAIQPVRATGTEALSALNQWLEQNGYPTESPEHMKYFVNAKFTFLCIKVAPPAGNAEIDRTGGLPPLRVSFRTPKLYYPLKFSSRQGVFDLRLTILTHEALDYKASSAVLKRIGWVDEKEYRPNLALGKDSFPASLAAVMADSVFKDLKGGWFVNVIEARHVNENNSIAGWSEDIFLDTRSR